MNNDKNGENMDINNNIYTITTKKILTLMIILMSIFLNQSSEIFGSNFSFADLFCLFVIIYLLMTNNMKLPFIPTIFFIVVSVTVLLTTMFFVPYKYNYSPVASSVIVDFIKLIAIFTYFLIGFNISKLPILEKSFKWYSVTALIMGIVGIVFTLLNVNLFKELLYFGSVRYRGVMNDPNYFAIIQVTALPYFIRAESIKVKYKVMFVLIIFTSILITGSKTGLITFVTYMLFLLILRVLKTKKTVKTLISEILIVTILVITFIFFSSKLEQILLEISNLFPVTRRVIPILTGDITGAISEGGSGRNETWKEAYEIIKTSPIIGVGSTAYADINEQLSGNRSAAHNTYLQLISQWGIPLALTFFYYIFGLITKITLSFKKQFTKSYVLRDIILILLIGSISISLSNARMFWFFFGALIANYNLKKYPK